MLIDALEPELKPALIGSPDLLSRGNITFDLLWTIFPPGCVAVGRLGSHNQVFLVRRNTTNVSMFGSSFNLSLAYLDFDGSKFGWCYHSVSIGGFGGVKKIDKLDILPQKYHQSQHELLPSLVYRGMKVAHLVKGAYKAYKGTVSSSGKATFVDGRIVIDPKGHEESDEGRSVYVHEYPSGLRELVPEEKDTAS